MSLESRGDRLGAYVRAPMQTRTNMSVSLWAVFSPVPGAATIHDAARGNRRLAPSRLNGKGRLHGGYRIAS
jgi:hypothetical protein